MRTRIAAALATSLVLCAPWSLTNAQDRGRERIADARTAPVETQRETRNAPPRLPRDSGRLSGTFVLAEPVQVVGQRIERGIARAVAEMSIFTRSFGARRLRQTNLIRRNLRTEVSGGRVTVAYGNLAYTTQNGQWRSVRDPQGNMVRLRHTAIDDRIVQRFRSNDGTKLTIYRFSPSGDRVTLYVTVTSPRLPAPLRYTLPYRSTGRTTLAAR